MAATVKTHLSYRQQVELLVSRGMRFDDEVVAEADLARIGYYRLSGYWYPYRRPPVLRGGPRLDAFAPGTTWNQVVALYEFDRRLKLLVMDAVERIEITLRVRIGYTLGMRHPFTHLDPQHLDPAFLRAQGRRRSDYEVWRERFDILQQRSTEDFVRHYEENYNGDLPIWVATEVMDFGSLSHLFAGARRVDREFIALNFAVRDPQGRGDGAGLKNWLRVINYLRNVCAHHSRLWNRNMTVQVAPSHLRNVPLLEPLGNRPQPHSRVYSALCVLSFLMRQVTPEQDWIVDTRRHLDSGLAATGRRALEMGAPSDWSDAAIWAVDPTA